MYPLDGLRDVFLEALHDGTFPQYYLGSYENVLAKKWDDALHEFNKHYDINRKGEWRYANKGKWLNGRCSVCGEFIPTDNAMDCITEDEVHYCPSCGAKMG